MRIKLFFLLAGFLLSAQLFAQKTVTGKVTGDEGSPLSDVSVLVKGAKTGTTTNTSGNYSITVPAGATTLVFSSVGRIDQEAVIPASGTLNVTLSSTAESMDEVIVVGYGRAVKKSEFTGSAVSVSDKDIDKRPISNVLVALQGSGPGVQTTAPGGGPGSSPGVTIRGVGSYSASTGALYVVDGVEYMGGMSNINPDDVESISVLKDAATIALFGSRGANGVVMITTKKGKSKQNVFGAKVQFGVNKNGVPNYNTVKPGEYYELMWEAYKNSLHYKDNGLPLDVSAQLASGKGTRNAANKQVYNGVAYDDIVQYLGNYNAFNVPNSELVSLDGKLNPNASLLYADDLNWLDQASKSGKRNEYGITFSGGSDKTDVYASVNYLQEEGWGLNSSIDRYAGRLNVNSRINNWLKTGVNIFANHNKYNNASTGNNSIVNPFYFSRSIGPIYPVHLHDPATGAYVLDDKGEKIFDLGNMVADYGLSRPYNSGRHTIAENLWNLDRSTRDFVGARAYIELNIRPWLSFSTNLSPEITNSRSEDYQNTIVGDGAPAGRYAQDWDRRFGYTFNQLVNINKKFNDHDFAVTLGHENVSSSEQDVSGRRTGQGFDDFYTFSNFADITTLSSGLEEYSVESYISRLNYNYQSKYYLSGSLRYDGDSKMPAINRWSGFWSIGAAWRIENEAFFNSDMIDQLKLRASYGRLGNSNLGDIGVYPYQPGYAIGNNNASYPGAVLSSLGSPDLRWEGQKPLDIGVDFSMWKGRLSGTIDYFDRQGDGLLFNVRQPYHNGGTTSGSFSIYKNVGNISNKGLEVSITGRIISQNNLNWNMTVNFSSINNKLTKMPEETPEIVSSPYKRVAGKSIYEYFTRSFYGVDPDNGRVLYRGIVEDGYDATNSDIIVLGKGDTLTYDQNLAKQDWIGKSALPKYFGSIVNNLSYKNFDFEFVITYSLGGYVVDGQYGGYMSPGPSNGATLHKDLLNGWRKPGDKTDIPRMDLSQTSQFGAASDRFLTKSDYINLSAVNVSYRIPQNLLERATMKEARVFISAENLWFATKREGLNTLSSLTSGASTSNYNLSRTLNVGLNFSF